MEKKEVVLILFGILALAALVFGYTHRANAESILFGSDCRSCRPVSSTEMPGSPGTVGSLL
jgi:hypothetical protein